jgi:hypothetical protein
MKQKIPPHLAILIVLVVITGISLVEGQALYALDHPPRHHVDCLSCHDDAKTIRAMRDKAGLDGPFIYSAYHAGVPAYFKGKQRLAVDQKK